MPDERQTKEIQWVADRLVRAFDSFGDHGSRLLLLEAWADIANGTVADDEEIVVAVKVFICESCDKRHVEAAFTPERDEWYEVPGYEGGF